MIILERIVNREVVVIQRRYVTPAVLESGVYNNSKEWRQMSWRGSVPRKEHPDLTNHLLSFNHKGHLCDLARMTLMFTAQVYAGPRKVGACEGSSPSWAASKSSAASSNKKLLPLSFWALPPTFVSTTSQCFPFMISTPSHFTVCHLLVAPEKTASCEFYFSLLILEVVPNICRI